MQHSWLVEVAERCEVVLAHQDVRVPQVRQVLCLGVQLVFNGLRITRKIDQYFMRMLKYTGGSAITCVTTIFYMVN